MYLGIDLGTSNSAVVGNDGRDLRLFKTADGYDVLPSAIMIDRRGATFVGKRAYDQDAFSPENIGKRFKRLMGTATPIVFKAAGRTMTPEEASSEVLKALLSEARMNAGEFDLEGAIKCKRGGVFSAFRVTTLGSMCGLDTHTEPFEPHPCRDASQPSATLYG
jgi:molecular chaperone DnaK